MKYQLRIMKGPRSWQSSGKLSGNRVTLAWRNIYTLTQAWALKVLFTSPVYRTEKINRTELDWTTAWSFSSCSCPHLGQCGCQLPCFCNYLKTEKDWFGLVTTGLCSMVGKVTWGSMWTTGTYKHRNNNSQLYHCCMHGALFHKKKARPPSEWARSVYLIFTNVLWCINHTATAPEICQHSRLNSRKHKTKFITKETLFKHNWVVTVTVMIG